MAVKKQDFYEGAALHILMRSGAVTTIRYQSPFFHLNQRFRAYLKYSTRVRSPWGFTFTSNEQVLLNSTDYGPETIIGLICGADGVAAINCEEYRSIAAPRKGAIHVSCYRLHGEHYEVNGPDGTLPRKVAPSAWVRLLSD